MAKLLKKRHFGINFLYFSHTDILPTEILTSVQGFYR